MDVNFPKIEKQKLDETRPIDGNSQPDENFAGKKSLQMEIVSKMKNVGWMKIVNNVLG